MIAPTPNAPNTPDTQLTLLLRRTFPATRDRVFSAWTDPAEFAKWWGPRGFTTPSAEIDLRVGGRIRVAMQPPEGEAFYLTGAFQEVQPPERLAPSTLHRIASTEPLPMPARSLAGSPPPPNQSRARAARFASSTSSSSTPTATTPSQVSIWPPSLTRPSTAPGRPATPICPPTSATSLPVWTRAPPLP